MAIISSTTLPLLLEECNNTLLKRQSFLMAANENGGIKTYRGGRQIEVAVGMRNHSQITSHTTTGSSPGFEPVVMAFSDPLETAVFNWGAFSEPIAVSIVTDMLNSGPEAKISARTVLLENAMDLMGRSINSQILAGVAGSGVAITGMETLYGAAAGVTTGHLEGIAKASQDNVVGGLSKATYNNRGWTNAFSGAAGNFAANGLNSMNSIWADIKDCHKGPRPIDAIIASPLSFGRYKTALFAREQYVNAKTLDGGILELAFNGAPLKIDGDMTVAGRAGDAIFSMYFLNFSGLKYLLNAKNTKKYSPSGDQNDEQYFMASLMPWTAPGYAVDAQLLVHVGQLVSTHLGSQGVLTNADA